jgi:hypothetical protein
MDSSFFSAVAAGLVVLILWAVLAGTARLIVRWRSSRLKPGPDAQRAREELESILSDVGALDRVRFAVHLILQYSKLQEEIDWRAAAINASQGDSERTSAEQREHAPSQVSKPVAQGSAFDANVFDANAFEWWQKTSSGGLHGHISIPAQ